jgi:hypothetical protein
MLLVRSHSPQADFKRVSCTQKRKANHQNESLVYEKGEPMNFQLIDFALFLLVVFFLMPNAAIYAILKRGRSVLERHKPEAHEKHS